MSKTVLFSKSLRRSVLVLTLGLSITAMTSSCSQWGGSKPVAKVGTHVITQKDVEYRDQVAKVFYPDQSGEPVGLQQLISAYTQAAIYLKHRRSLDETILEAEASRIDANSKDPKGLARIKEIFGGDRKSYLKVFVLPTLVERAIYFDLFQNEQAIHLATRKKAGDFLKEARSSPARFKELAKKHSLQYSRVQLSPELGLIHDQKPISSPDEKPKPGAKGLAAKGMAADADKAKQLTHEVGTQLAAAQLNEAKEWLQRYIVPAQSGEVVAEIIHHQEAWIVMRRLGWNRKKNIYDVEFAVVPKTDFTDWLNEQKKAVKIERF